jgi:predicted enzyme related to lactoylglutathione lyase
MAANFRAPLRSKLVPPSPAITPRGLIAMPNPFVHIELNSTDVDKSKAFYGKLFGWKLSDMQMPEFKYTMVDVGKGTGGGMMPQLMPNAPSAWLPYVQVDDIDSATKKAEKLGAEIMKAGQEVQGMGWLTIFIDPTGALLGLWEPKKGRPARRRQPARRKVGRRRAASARRR